MNDAEKVIQEALRQEDAEFMKDFDREVSAFEMIMDSFRGRHRRLMILNAFWILVFLALGVVSAVQFFGAESTRDQLMWAVVFIFCVSAVAMLKVMYWMELSRNALTREIKRLELQVAQLATHIKR